MTRSAETVPSEERLTRADTYTVVVRQPVTPQQVVGAQATLDALIGHSADQAGFVSGASLRGGTATAPTLYVVLRFDTETSWRTWRNSPDVGTRLDALEAHAGRPDVQRVSEGLEGWFAQPTSPAVVVSPPKWKMAISTWITILPLLLVTNLVLSPVIGGLPGYVTLAIGTAVTIPVMTWFGMPFTTRVLKRWLYPATR